MSSVNNLPYALGGDVKHFSKLRIGLTRRMTLANLLVAFGACHATRHGGIQIPKDDILGLLYLGKDRTRLRL